MKAASLSMIRSVISIANYRHLLPISINCNGPSLRATQFFSMSMRHYNSISELISQACGRTYWRSASACKCSRSVSKTWAAKMLTRIDSFKVQVWEASTWANWILACWVSSKLILLNWYSCLRDSWYLLHDYKHRLSFFSSITLAYCCTFRLVSNTSRWLESAWCLSHCWKQMVNIINARFSIWLVF